MRSTLPAAALLLATSPAWAHDVWANGSPIPLWVNTSCCGPEHVHHLTPDQVHRINADYYKVDGYEQLIPAQSALPSQDGDYWIFYEVRTNTSQTPRLYCFFVPMSS